MRHRRHAQRHMRKRKISGFRLMWNYNTPKAMARKQPHQLGAGIAPIIGGEYIGRLTPFLNKLEHSGMKPIMN